ncbi:MULTISPECIES: hypothetical protein [Pseudoalteromonas]|uniref:hypothetical protein n=1 Tax=Pseudoalteromonas TaxID=53246 RepID=UPI0019D16340|nr:MULTISPECIES: hypothetical protein [Pseudoalteromonas]MBR8845051.1 hypothetical protein [Pseudoalteromonas sp. JC3]UDM63556.1 hypothetical protein KIJ96_21625 [Pseudoalteromonas piscicida]WJE11037.1 hypothetical protein QSH61_23415 [Pseudoalteromonas sp. JC3]
MKAHHKEVSPPHNRIWKKVVALLALGFQKIVSKVMETEVAPKTPQEIKEHTEDNLPPIDFGRPVEETPLLPIADSVPRRKKVKGGFKRVPVQLNSRFMLSQNNLMASNKDIKLVSVDLDRIDKLSNAAFAYMATICAFITLYFYLATREVVYIKVVAVLLSIAIPIFIHVGYVKRTSAEVLRVDFFRHSGLVTFPIGNNVSTFSLALDDVDLYIGKVSAGRGVQFNMAYLVPKRYPKHLRHQPMYPVDWEPRDLEDSMELWSEIHRFMDNTQPIPASFYKGWQEVIESSDFTEQDKIIILGEDLVKQAPFYDLENDRPLDKVIW